jgi:hypothetical protein
MRRAFSGCQLDRMNRATAPLAERLRQDLAKWGKVRGQLKLKLE